MKFRWTVRRNSKTMSSEDTSTSSPLGGADDKTDIVTVEDAIRKFLQVEYKEDRYFDERNVIFCKDLT